MDALGIEASELVLARVALVVYPGVLRVLLVEMNHDLIAVDFGDHTGRSYTEAF